MEAKKPTNVDEYIADFPVEQQAIMEKIRTIIKHLVPDAEETISYAMPAYKLHGAYLVYFAGFKNHIGFYATPTGHAEFKEEMAGYKHGKGSVQFPLDKPMPYDLMERIVKFRVNEHKQKSKK